MKIRITKSALRDPRFGLYAAAKKFIKSYEGFSHSTEKNGEEYLLSMLSGNHFKVVFDVGANIGDWTRLALTNFQQAEVHSFEISEQTYKALTAQHRGNARVVMNNFGLSNEEGEVEYKDYGKNSGGNSLLLSSDLHDHWLPVELKKALVRSGDEYCREKNISQIDFLKIDVEGAEIFVLEGFSDLLKKGAIKIIQFEYGYTSGDAHFLMKDFYNLFEKHGYLIGPLKPNGVIFMDFDYALNDFNSGPNFVAIHKNCTSLIKKIKGRPIKGYPRR